MKYFVRRTKEVEKGRSHDGEAVVEGWPEMIKDGHFIHENERDVNEAHHHWNHVNVCLVVEVDCLPAIEHGKLSIIQIFILLQPFELLCIRKALKLVADHGDLCYENRGYPEGVIQSRQRKNLRKRFPLEKCD